MLQKIIVGLLAFTVIGAAGVGIYDSTKSDSDSEQVQVLASPAQDDAATAPVNESMEAAVDAPADTAANVADVQPAAPDAAPQVNPTATPEIAIASGAMDGTGPAQTEQQQAIDMVGEPWAAVGTIAALDTAGMTLTLGDGSQIYVELGPSHYWQNQAVTLAEGESVTVEGFYNGDQYHAATVTKMDGSKLAVRTADGLPLWSGGASGTNSGQNGATAGNGQAEIQVAAEDWITVEGTVTAVNASSLTVQTQAGEMLTLQLGEPSFMQQQGIAFAAGDAISALGFWQETMFRAGEITKLATGERLMLLDPNGRPLWGGPGRAGNRGGQAQDGSTAGQTQSTTAQGQASQGGNQGQGSQGQGSQGQGGQGQGQNQGVQVPATQWETLAGYVTMVEPLAFTLQLQDGQTVRVMLGEMDFWSQQGLWFSVNDQISVDGYWLNGQFEAGVVTLGNGQQLTVRDQYGRLLWADSTQAGQGGQGGQGQDGQGGQGQGGQGGGNGYRGGR